MLRNALATYILFCPGLLALGQNCFTPADPQEDRVKISTILRKDSATEVSYCGKQFLGIPYVAHTLEINDPEQLVVNLRELDCSTFMETSLALARTARILKEEGSAFVDTFALYCRNLQEIRYRRGLLDHYPSRLHYICDWAKDNEEMGIIQDITAIYSPDTYPTRIGYMSANPHKYSQLTAHPEFIPAIRATEKRCNLSSFFYLPQTELPVQGKEWIHEGDLIAMLTTIKGLDVSHVGIAVYCGDELHLMHASSLEKRVIIDPRPLSVQIAKKSCPGIRVFRLVPQNE